MIPRVTPDRTLVINMVPTPKGRPRFGSRRKKDGSTIPAVFPDRRSDNAERFIKTAWGERYGDYEPLDGPLTVAVWVGMLRPKGHFRANGELSKAGLALPAPAKRPDIDNLVKLVTDALNGVAWKDDAQIAVQYAEKHWDVRNVVTVAIWSM